MNTLNYIILIIGLIVISAIWNIIAAKNRKKGILIVTISVSILSIIVYFLQSTLWPVV